MNYFSLEAEAAVIGSILIDDSLATDMKVKSEHFYNEDYASIFSALESLRDAGSKIDIVTVASHLKERIEYLGGVKTLSELSSSVPSTSSFKEYERIIIDKYVFRSGLTTLHAMRTKEYDDPKQFVNEIRSVADGLEVYSQAAKGLQHVSTAIDEHAYSLMDRSEGKVKRGLINLGMDLHKITGGWLDEDYVILAARPSVGKTAAMLQDAKMNAQDGVLVAIFSAELSTQPLVERVICSECNLDLSLVKSGELNEEEWHKYTAGASSIRDLDIYIDDTPGISIQDIQSEVKKMRANNPDRKMAIYIDYLQLLSGGMKFPNRNAEVSYISGALKQIARENKCPVISLAQLSRSVEQRQDKRPMMSDLRDSGSIEQDADIVIFMYRDDYYNAESEKKNIVEFIVSKNRNGGVGTAEMVFLKSFSKFANCERVHSEMFMEE